MIQHQSHLSQHSQNSNPSTLKINPSQFQTQIHSRNQYKKCSVRKIISKHLFNQKKNVQKSKLGFFVPNLNLFVLCQSKSQYYQIKRQIMKTKLSKTKGLSDGFCYKKSNKKLSDNSVDQRSVLFKNDNFYDANSDYSDVEHIQML